MKVSALSEDDKEQDRAEAAFNVAQASSGAVPFGLAGESGLTSDAPTPGSNRGTPAPTNTTSTPAPSGTAASTLPSAPSVPSASTSLPVPPHPLSRTVTTEEVATEEVEMQDASDDAHTQAQVAAEHERITAVTAVLDEPSLSQPVVDVPPLT